MLILEHDVRGKGGGKTGYVIAVALLPETSGLSILVITVAYLKSNHLFARKSFNIIVLVCCLSFNIMECSAIWIIWIETWHFLALVKQYYWDANSLFYLKLSLCSYFV